MDALWYLMLHIFGFILEYLSILGIGLGRAALFLPTCQHTLDSAMNTPNQRIRACAIITWRILWHVAHLLHTVKPVGNYLPKVPHMMVKEWIWKWKWKWLMGIGPLNPDTFHLILCPPLFLPAPTENPRRNLSNILSSCDPISHEICVVLCHFLPDQEANGKFAILQIITNIHIHILWIDYKISISTSAQRKFTGEKYYLIL